MSDPDLFDDDDRPQGFGWLWDILRTWLPAILAVFLIRTYVFEPFRIPSGSMVPTLQIGDHVVVNKASYGLWVPSTLVEVPFMELAWVVPRYEWLDWGDPERGDIIVFRFPRNESLNYIKRVVAVPGDTIRVKNNQIFIDDQAQDQVYQDRYDFVDDDCNVSTTKRYLENFDGEDHEVVTNAGLPSRLATWPRRNDTVTVPDGMVFVMGDNRDNSEDSRAWEFVRYDQIKGKAHFVWFSWNSCAEGSTVGGPRSDRFFRNLYSLVD